jgi:hypothetical protein
MTSEDSAQKVAVNLLVIGVSLLAVIDVKPDVTQKACTKFLHARNLVSACIVSAIIAAKKKRVAKNAAYAWSNWITYSYHAAIAKTTLPVILPEI